MSAQISEHPMIVCRCMDNLGVRILWSQRPRIVAHGGVQFRERARRGGAGYAVDGHRAAGASNARADVG